MRAFLTRRCSQVDEKIDDKYFVKTASKGKTSAEEEFFADGKPKEKEAYPEAKASTQKSVDEGIIAAVKGVENLSAYLKSSWGLTKVGCYPVVVSPRCSPVLGL